MGGVVIKNQTLRIESPVDLLGLGLFLYGVPSPIMIIDKSTCYRRARLAASRSDLTDFKVRDKFTLFIYYLYI